MQRASTSYYPACICSTIGKHTFAWIKCFCCGKAPIECAFGACLLHSIAISIVWISQSFFSEAYINTPRYFTWSKIVHVHRSEKHLMEQIVFAYAWDSEIFFCVKCNFCVDVKLRPWLNNFHKPLSNSLTKVNQLKSCTHRTKALTFHCFSP